MVRRPRVLATTATVMAALVLAGCGGSDDEPEAGGGSSSDELTTVRTVFQPGFSTLVVPVAVDQGCFEEQGIELEYTEGGELATYAAALDQQYDIVFSVAGVFLSGARQLDTVAVSGLQTNIPDLERSGSPLVTKDPDIEGPLDLMGKTVGVPTLTGTSAQGTLYQIDQLGGDSSTVELVQVPFASQLEQLEAGNVDAVVSAIPFWTPMVDQGYRVVFDAMVGAAQAAGGGEISASSFFISTRSYAEANPEVVEGFREGIRCGIEWIEGNEDEARAELQEYLQLPPEVAQGAPLPGYSADMPEEHLAPFITMLTDLGVLEPGLDAEDVVWNP
jgi:NitT/TauT family transport system substrate-binding protein